MFNVFFVSDIITGSPTNGYSITNRTRYMEVIRVYPEDSKMLVDIKGLIPGHVAELYDERSYRVPNDSAEFIRYDPTTRSTIVNGISNGPHEHDLDGNNYHIDLNTKSTFAITSDEFGRMYKVTPIVKVPNVPVDLDEPIIFGGK